MKQRWKKHAGKMAGVLVLLILAGFGLTYWREIWAVLTRPQAVTLSLNLCAARVCWVYSSFWASSFFRWWWLSCPVKRLNSLRAFFTALGPGLLLCLLGILLASCTVYAFVRLFGAKRIDEKAFTKYRFLRDEAHIRFSVFLVFFIPGTPKDLLTYLGPFLPIPAWQFLIISTLARIPSVLTSTFAASQLAEGSWQVSVAVFAVTGLVALLCLAFEEHILTWFRRRHAEK